MADIGLAVVLTLKKLIGTVSSSNFSIGLLFAKHTTASKFTGRTKLYTDADSVKKDFGADADEYKASLAYFSASPKPEKLRIAKRDTPVATSKKLTFSRAVISPEKIQGSVNGVTLDDTPFDTNMQTTMNNLKAKIEAIDGVASATVSSTPYLEITVLATVDYTLDLDGFTVIDNATAITVTPSTVTAGRSIFDDYSDAKNDKNDFYLILATDRSDGLTMSLARILEAEFKMFGFATSTSAVKTTVTTDIVSKLKSKAFEKTWAFWHQTLSEFADCAFAGNILAYPPGQAQYAFKTLPSITVTPLESDEITNLEDKNANIYVDIAGVNVTHKGVCVNGVFIDIVRDLAYLQAKVNENMVAYIIAQPKIPGGQLGIDNICDNLRLSLLQMNKEGIITPDFKIIKPKLSDIPANSRINRILDKISFVINIQGAWIKVILDGTALA